MFSTGDFYMGMKIIVDDDNMSDTVEDWSNVRSHSRAIRRQKRGFRQNIRLNIIPKADILHLKEQNTLIMHSSIYAKLKKEAVKYDAKGLRGNGQYGFGSYY